MKQKTSIKLVGYPYQDHAVGEICDLGYEKNCSMVDLGRAVWIDNPNQPIVARPAAPIVEPEPEPEVEVAKTTEVVEETPITEEVAVETSETDSPAPAPKRKLVTNKLKDKVAQKTQTDAKSFWDRLR